MVVTPDLLAEEFDRVEKTTRAPDQWEAIKKALGDDRRRIEEAFCRPLLVERALRARFAFDQGIHTEPHQKARLARAAFMTKKRVEGASVRTLRRRAEAAASVDAMLDKARAEASGPRVLRPPTEPDKDAPLPVGVVLAGSLASRRHASAQRRLAAPLTANAANAACRGEACTLCESAR